MSISDFLCCAFVSKQKFPSGAGLSFIFVVVLSPKALKLAWLSLTDKGT